MYLFIAVIVASNVESVNVLELIIGVDEFVNVADGDYISVHTELLAAFII